MGNVYLFLESLAKISYLGSLILFVFNSWKLTFVDKHSHGAYFVVSAGEADGPDRFLEASVLGVGMNIMLCLVK